MIKVKVSDIEDKLEEFYDNDGAFNMDEEPVEINVSDDSILSAEGPEITIPGLGICLREGTMLTKTMDDEYEPDWSLTVIYSIGDTAEHYLYYEQDGVLTTLHNYLNTLPKKPNGNVSEMDATINID